MTEAEIRRTVLGALASVAPELDEATLLPDRNFREQLDVDSMDFLNYVIAIHNAFKLDIPEADYPRLLTINGATRYVAGRLGKA